MKFITKLLLIAFIAVPTISNSLGQKKKRIDLLAIPEVTRDKVICFSLYTVHNKTLKLTAQFYPLLEGESRKARLEIKRDNKWIKVSETSIIERGWTAPFKVKNWDDSQQTTYRVRHGESASYEGIIQKNPILKDNFVPGIHVFNQFFCSFMDHPCSKINVLF